MDSTPSMLSPSPCFNVALVIEGRKLYSIKGYLAFHSPVFTALFFGDFAEKDKEEVEIKDVNFDDMHLMQKILWKANQSINERNVTSMLQLADRFQIKSLLHECEQFLSKDYPHFSFVEKIVYADQYRLASLKEVVLERASADDIEELKLSHEYASLEQDTIDRIIERRNQIIQNLMEYSQRPHSYSPQ